MRKSDEIIPADYFGSSLPLGALLQRCKVLCHSEATRVRRHTRDLLTCTYQGLPLINNRLVVDRGEND